MAYIHTVGEEFRVFVVFVIVNDSAVGACLVISRFGVPRAGAVTGEGFVAYYPFGPWV